MISFIHSKDLDKEKYNYCIENSLQSSIYGYFWYLDIVCENWSAFVLDDYKAVMPVPWNKKYTIKYVYPPLWVLELGVFSIDSVEVDAFIEALFSQFKFVELRLNTQNKLVNFTKEASKKEMHWLSLSDTDEVISSKYRKDRKKDLLKATKFNLKEIWNDDPKSLITLFKNNIGERDKNIKKQDYLNLLILITTCIEKKIGEVLTIYNSTNELVASAFFIKHKNKVTILVSSTDLKNRKNGANTFLINSAIKKYQEDFDIFNFGGSSIKTIASYFKSFGAQESTYNFMKQNKLPFLVRLLKR